MSNPQISKKESSDVNLLRDELQVALLAAEDIRALRAKVSVLVVRIREEKEKRLLVEENQSAIHKKLEMVTDHMEKLMNHLRIESKQKQKIIDSRRSTRRELLEMREICQRQQKIIASKNRYIHEITEGSKLLEDQLRLMDDKYLDMRKKLDYAREAHKNDVNKAERKMTELRRKFAAITGSNKPLDNFPMPTGPNTLESQRGVSWADFADSPDGPGASNSFQKYGMTTPTQGMSRAKSAPAKRPGTKQSTGDTKANEPTWEKVSAKIEKKKRAMGGNWDVDKAYEVLEEAQIAGGMIRRKPKAKEGGDAKTRDGAHEASAHYSDMGPESSSASSSVSLPIAPIPSAPSPMSYQQLPTPQLQPGAMTTAQPDAPRLGATSPGKSFSILGKQNKYARDEDF